MKRPSALTMIVSLLGSGILLPGPSRAQAPEDWRSRSDTCSGIVWGPIVKLSFDAEGSGGGNYSPRLAVQGDTIHCVWAIAGTNAVRLPYARSTDDGRTWSEPRELLDSTTFPIPHGWHVLTAHRGRLYLFFDELIPGVPSGQGAGVYLIVSTDHGATWTSPVLTSTDTLIGFFSASVRGDTMAQVIVPYRNHTVQYPRVNRSSDGGESWTKNPIDMPSSSSDELRVVLTPGLLNFFHPGDRWPGPTHEIVLHRSTDLGNSWKDSLVLSSRDGEESRLPNVCSWEDPATGTTTIGVIWRDAKYGICGEVAASVLARFSRDNGKTWEPEIRLNDGPPCGVRGEVTVRGNTRAASWTWMLPPEPPERIQVRIGCAGVSEWGSVCEIPPIGIHAGISSVILTRSAIHVAWEEGTGPLTSTKFNIYYRRGELPGPLLSTRSLLFDTVGVGCNEFRSVRVQNRRCDPLALVASIAGPDQDEFTLDVPSPPGEGVLIGWQDSLTITVRFSPVQVTGGTEEKSAYLILHHDQQQQQHSEEADTVFLSGTAQATGTETIALTDTLGVGWQLVSLPVEPSCAYRLPRSFFFENSRYHRTDTLVPGKGYWNKLAVAQLWFAGNLLDELTIPVMPHWNIIGSISRQIAVSEIESNPPGMIVSQFFGYSESRYIPTDTIRPGRSYWVRVSEEGELRLEVEGGGGGGGEGLSGRMGRATDNTDEGQRSGGALENWRRSGAVENRSTGRVEKEWSQSRRFGPVRIVATGELPPPPPAGDDTHIEDRTSDIPQSFSLEQNYPNPFNPETVIGYSLPVQSRVVVKVYDVLGREVATLIDGVRDAGYGQVHWDAEDLPGGVYFYKLVAGGSFVRVKKALLVR